jgi:hypothetical protein
MRMIGFVDKPRTAILNGGLEYDSIEGISQSFLKSFDYDSGGCPALAKYWYEHPEERVSTPAQSHGTRWHHFLLQPDSFEQFYSVLTIEVEQRLFELAKDGKSKAKGFSTKLNTYLDWKRDQEEHGRKVVSVKEAEELRRMRDAILSNKDIAEWFEFGESKLEVAVLAPFEFGDGSKLQLKGRIDIVPPCDVLLDLKSCRSAHPREFARAVNNYGLDIQAAYYIDLCRKNGLPKKRFGFLSQDKFPPYLACIHWLPEDWIRYGAVRYRKILGDLAAAIKFNEWPGYQTGELMPPDWLLPAIEAIAA